MESKEDKVEEVEKTEKIQVMNASFELFTPGSTLNESVMRLKLQVDGDDAVDLRTFIKRITESPEYKAYEEMRNELIRKFLDEQERFPEETRIQPTARNIPEWMRLMNRMSKLKIERFRVKVSGFPRWEDPEKRLNANDQDLLDGLFEFVKSREGNEKEE